MFLHSPVLDIGMFFSLLYLFRMFILVDETANEDAKLLVKHSKLWIRVGLWMFSLCALIYITLSDFSMIDGKFYIECWHILFAMFYLLGVYDNFVGYKYGSKDLKNRKKSLHQLLSIIAVTILILFIYFL